MENNIALKVMRIKHHMTQAELAERLGVNRSYISDIERGSLPGGNNFWATVMIEFGLTTDEVDRVRKGIVIS